MPRYDIVVAGAGTAGLTVAALLAQSACREHISVTVIDAAALPSHTPEDDIALRVSAIATGSAELLDGIGAWSHIADTRVCPYRQMRVWDQADSEDSPAALLFDAAEFAVPQLGFIVENALLQQALLRVLDDLGVERRFETPLRRIARQGRRFQLGTDSGPDLNADLLIAADGARSFVRNHLAIETQTWPYDQQAFVTHLQPDKPHGNTARQRFLRDGPLGMLPLADGRISVVWSTTPATAAEAVKMSDEQLAEQLSEASDFVLGNLRVAGPRGSFPLCAQHAKHYVMPGVALIGDAAHAIHPLAGQGANLGMQDAAELVATVEHALTQGRHPGDRPVLRRYERARKGANATMLHFMTGLNGLFRTDSALLGELRSAGMRLFNRSGPVREKIVGVALGVER